MYACETTAQIEIACDVGLACERYADIERFPEYAPLLQSVRILDDGTSAWALQVPRLLKAAARAVGMGSLVNWEASYVVDYPQRLAWQSITGFQNAGVATFEPLGERHCRVTVRMTYAVPATLRPFQRSRLVTRLLERTMVGAMERFREGLEDAGGDADTVDGLGGEEL